jgi:UDPglucose--hexose-1-phosphate uridylyltransferase
MPELRLNLIAREWVVVVCERAKRPEEFRQRRERRYRPPHEASCPFCTGNEGKTPAETMRVSDDGGWKIRVAPNKFYTLSPEGERVRVNEGLKHLVTGVGRHEVIIEHPRHDMTLALMEPEEVRMVLGVYRERFTEAFKDRRVQHVIIFKNHGVASGTTLAHPHSQLIGTPVMPFQVRHRIEEAMRYFDNIGECLMCGMLDDEVKDGKRIIMDSEHFVSFVPYAALSPFHIWIFPKRHMPSFASTKDEELSDLAHVLRDTLAKLYHGLDDPDFNFVIRSASPYRRRSEYLHWYLSIVPRVISSSGFELGSGMHVNHAIPEQVAGFMRGVRVS